MRLGVWLRSREGIGWLAAGTIPNSLYGLPFFYLWHVLCVIVPLFLSFLFCFVLMLSLELFVNVPLIFSCLVDHVVPD